MLLCDLADFGRGSCWHSAGFSMHSICVYKFYTYMPALTSMKAVSYITYCDLTINRVWSVLALSQWIQNFSHMPSFLVGVILP